MKAIETVYNGYRFRSRLEARWAVFFDTLGLKYQYEPEGFDLDGLWYLPDFYLPDWDFWIEIKPCMPSRLELQKIQKLFIARNSDRGAGKEVATIFCGSPWFPKFKINLNSKKQIRLLDGYISLTVQPEPIGGFCVGAFRGNERGIDVWPIYLPAGPGKLSSHFQVDLSKMSGQNEIAEGPYFSMNYPNINFIFRGYIGDGFSYRHSLLENAYMTARQADFRAKN